jgi:hypothetical protein
MGLGILLTLVAAPWRALMFAGVAMVVLSLPFQCYDIYLKTRSLRTDDKVLPTESIISRYRHRRRMRDS